MLACSGGVDSVVLAQLCKAAGLDFVLAHCNFQLRASESDADEKFVKDLGVNLNIKTYVNTFNTVDYISKNKVNIQIAARELRYAWFAELMQDLGCKTIVTAHHADDNLETFIINLSRGTGIHGLTGIPEKTPSISRPLLPFSRDEILKYAATENLNWREDRSNSETKYLRNKIRHEIVPLLKQLHPTFLDNFEKTRSYVSDTAEIAENHLNTVKAAIFEPTASGFRVSIDALNELRPQQGYLHGLFSAYGFTAWKDIARLITAMSGKEIRSKTHRLLKDRAQLLLETVSEETAAATYVVHEAQEALSVPFKMLISSVKALNGTGSEILYVDEQTLKYPLTVRKWKKGDYFYPLGMQGKKKLSKYFKDEKIDVLTKEKQWLLCSDEKIVWVIGRRPDRRFSVSKDTKKILKFKIN